MSKQKLVIIGATGMVGGEALSAALAHPEVGSVATIGRAARGPGDARRGPEGARGEGVASGGTAGYEMGPGPTEGRSPAGGAGVEHEQAQVKRGRGRPQTLDRGRTVEVSMTSYWRDGVREVSMNEVCRRAKVSKPGVYREFGSEDGLTAAAVALYHETVLAPLVGLLAAELPFAVVLDRLISWLTEPNGKPVGCLMAELRAAPGALGPLTAAKVAEVHEQTRQAYEGWVQRAAARGEVSPTVSPALASRFIAAQLAGVALEMRIGGDPALVRAQAELAFRALAPPAAPAAGPR